MCTAQFDSTNFAYCPTQCICIFRLILTINDHEFLIQQSVNPFFFFVIFIVTQCVLCDVRTEFLSIIESRSSFYRPCHGSGAESMEKDSVQFQASPCGVFSGRSDKGTSFPPSTSVLSVSIFLPMFHVCLYLCHSSQRANKRSLGNFQKHWPFVNQGTLYTQLLSVFSLFEGLK